MNFNLDADQCALRDSLKRLLRDHFDFQARQSMCAHDIRFPVILWDHYKELGLTALWAPESVGGFGGGAPDLIAVLPAMGEALTLDPYRESVVVASTVLRQAVADDEFRDLLSSVADGRLRLSWAHDEGANPVIAAGSDSTWQLSGVKPSVAFGDTSQGFLLTAKHETASDDAVPSVFYVPQDAKGLAVTAVRLVDDTPAALLDLQGVRAKPVWWPGSNQSIDAWKTTELIGMAAACAEMLGVMEGAFKLTTEYVTVRSQFGRKLAENQAVKHQLAEMCVNLEMCRSMAIAAVLAAAKGDEFEVYQGKYVLGEYGRRLCHTAIQLHGGIGMTEEHRIGHYLRRLHVLDQRFGSVNTMVERLALQESDL